jgi:hypothetical protein
MTYTLELIPRGTHDVTTEEHHHPVDAAQWTFDDAATIVRKMLRALDRLSPQTAEGERTITLRGISWIVSTYEGGSVIALDIPSGQAVAGPFAIDRDRLHDLVTAAMSHGNPPTTVH